MVAITSPGRRDFLPFESIESDAFGSIDVLVASRPYLDTRSLICGPKFTNGESLDESPVGCISTPAFFFEASSLAKSLSSCSSSRMVGRYSRCASVK